MKPRRFVQLIRPGVDELAVVKITEMDEAGWPSPAWYAVRRGAAPHTYALARLGARRLYSVELGDEPETSRCECLGSGGDGGKTCRHIGALHKLVTTGQKIFGNSS